MEIDCRTLKTSRGASELKLNYNSTGHKDQACRLACGAVGNFWDVTIPTPSFITTSWFASIFEIVSVFPFGQRISAFAVIALPKPK